MSRAFNSLALALLVLALTACEVITAPFPGTSATAPPTAQTGSAQPSLQATLPAPVLLQRALAARAAADDSAAADDLSALLQAYPDAPETTPARYYLAESYALRGRWTSAAELLRVFLATAAPAEPLRAPALFLLARAHEAAGVHQAAIDAYRQYRDLATSIEPYAAMRQAAQERALGQSDAAIASYLSAARSTVALGERSGSFEKAIALLQESGRPAEALDLYVELLALSHDRLSYRVRIYSEAAALAQSLGQSDQAKEWLRQIVVSGPDLPEAAAAADQLLAAGDGSITPAEAGRIYVAAERWADAVAQLDLALAAASAPEERAELGRLRGLALRAQDDLPGALAALAEAAAHSPDSEAGRQAQLDWVQTIGQSGETERAIQGYAEYADTYPDDPRAPIALDRVTQLRERLGDGEGALQARLDLGRRYPASDEGLVALHQAGLAFFTAGRHYEARQAWQVLAEGNSGAMRARGAYWAGRAARAYGDEQAARALFETARAAAPDTYEGARAAEELGGITQGNLSFEAPITEAQWAELRDWATGWSATGTSPDPTAPLGVTAERAAQLRQVGLQLEAIAEWEQAGRELGTPAGLVKVARAAHQAGATYPALLLAQRLVAQADQSQSGESPPAVPPQPLALRRLLFPTPYPELVRREAAARGLDPRLLYALFRQESLFNPGATSWVGARGLGQVMPETGQGIAQNLEVADFTLDDLYRPSISIRFGAYYLGRRIEDLAGSVHGALAAYNGGLGNAQRWAGGDTVADADLFTESIDFPETKGYVRAVYGFWGAYQGLYAP